MNFQYTSVALHFFKYTSPNYRTVTQITMGVNFDYSVSLEFYELANWTCEGLRHD